MRKGLEPISELDALGRPATVDILFSRPIYFEFLMWPTYVIFAVWGIAFFPTRLLDLLKTVSTPAFRWARSERASIFVMLVLLVAIPVFPFWHAWPVNNLERTYAIPPSKSAMIALLKEQVGLTPGAPFRGRVVTMEFVHKAEPIEWGDVADQIGSRYAATGNDYWTGLWYHDIPTLFQYTSTVAPDFFRAVTHACWLDPTTGNSAAQFCYGAQTPMP